MAKLWTRIALGLAIGSLAWSLMAIATVGPAYKSARRAYLGASGSAFVTPEAVRSLEAYDAVRDQIKRRSNEALMLAVPALLVAFVLVLRRTTRTGAAYASGGLAIVAAVLAILVHDGVLWR